MKFLRKDQLIPTNNSVYPYEYMGDWGKFDKKLSPQKEDFYSHLNMEDISDADYPHAKQFVKILKYHDLLVQNDALLLADVFENF